MLWRLHSLRTKSCTEWLLSDHIFEMDEAGAKKVRDRCSAGDSCHGDIALNLHYDDSVVMKHMDPLNRNWRCELSVLMKV